MNLLLPRLFRHLSCPPGPLCKVLGSALAYYFLGRVSHQLLPASNSLLESLFLPEGPRWQPGYFWDRLWLWASCWGILH